MVDVINVWETAYKDQNREMLSILSIKLKESQEFIFYYFVVQPKPYKWRDLMNFELTKYLENHQASHQCNFLFSVFKKIVQIHNYIIYSVRSGVVVTVCISDHHNTSKLNNCQYVCSNCLRCIKLRLWK